MASYVIVINVVFVAFVVAGIAGSLLWAIATQQRDWPSAAKPAGRAPEAAELISAPVTDPALATA